MAFQPDCHRDVVEVSTTPSSTLTSFLSSASATVKRLLSDGMNWCLTARSIWSRTKYNLFISRAHSRLFAWSSTEQIPEPTPSAITLLTIDRRGPTYSAMTHCMGVWFVGMVLANTFVENASRGACQSTFFIRRHEAQSERSRTCRLDKWSV